MRAKIILDTNLQSDEIRSQFRHIDNCSVYNCDASDATGHAIFQRVIATVAPQDKQDAEGGAQFTFTHPLFESEGLVSFEHGHFVVRVLNEGIIALRASCAKIVKYFGKYCRRNRRKIRFPTKISVLEISGRKPVIDGKILVLWKDRFKEAINQKFIEFLVSIIGVIVFLSLLYITRWQYWHWQDLNARPWDAAWLLDLLSKLVGSVAVTTLLSLVVFLATLWDLHRYTIKWEIPEAGGTE